MKTINEEQVVSCLFAMGFDTVDSTLGSLTAAKLLYGFGEVRRFQLGDNFSQFFRTYVAPSHNRIGYKNRKLKIKDEYSLFLTNVGDKEESISLADAFANRYPELMEDVRKIDFREIMIKKIQGLDLRDIDNFSTQFCDKEKEIIMDMFGMNPKFPQYEPEERDTTKVLVKR